MHKYKLVFTCANGYEGEETVMAVNRKMAFDCFEAFGYENVVSLECYRVENKKNKKEKGEE